MSIQTVDRMFLCCFGWCCPSAIPGIVSAGVVYAFDRMAVGSIAHVCRKALNAEEPIFPKRSVA